MFEHKDNSFALVAGSGRGAGWVGLVELTAVDEALVGQSWRHGTAQRTSGRQRRHVAGPYYARHAVAVPVGQRHVVVYGGDRAITLRDSELVQLAAAEVDGSHGVSADKLLADELELVHALRSLMAYRPLTVRDTARHIVAVAGQALSCEVAVIRLELDGQPLIEGLDLRSMSALASPDAQGHLAVGPSADAVIEQVAPAQPDIFGVEVASHLTLPLGGGVTGAMALGHTMARARGFTSLCQRIGRAIADAAELLISQAHAREQLAAERDLLARLVRTDALTGGANRHAWDDAVTAYASDPDPAGGYVLCCDIDGLKVVNDRFGHAAGDAVIRGASNLLRACVRDGDLVARVGGDEFVVLLANADATAARRVAARIRRAQRAWRVTESGLMPGFSLGYAQAADGDLETARATADRSMYRDKRLRLTAAERSDRRKASKDGSSAPNRSTRVTERPASA